MIMISTMQCLQLYSKHNEGLPASHRTTRNAALFASTHVFNIRGMCRYNPDVG